MSEQMLTARSLAKHYKNKAALDGVDLDIQKGTIVGLIGPNGAGKTTLMKAMLGLIPFEGELNILGLDPRKQRTRLLEDVCFMADTAILPRWMRVSELLRFVEGVHPRFNKAKAENFLSTTEIQSKSKVGHLSKGMITQLHLALVLAIDARILVLDEPTLGLDIVHRKDFYRSILGDYFDEDKTIIVTTHQVEEVEHILTDLVFIEQGKIILNEKMDNIPDLFIEIEVDESKLGEARQLSPLYEEKRLGGAMMIFKREEGADYSALGKTKIPSVSDLYLAKMQYKSRANSRSDESDRGVA